MELNDPWNDFIDIFDLKPIRRLLRINSIGISAPWSDYLVSIVLHAVKQCPGLTQ